jgi:hypothetical protein
MKARWSFALAALIVGCHGAPPRDAPGQAARSVAMMDTAAVRRLCASPDSVIAGQRPCELRDQGVVRTKPQR